MVGSIFDETFSGDYFDESFDDSVIMNRIRTVESPSTFDDSNFEDENVEIIESNFRNNILNLLTSFEPTTTTELETTSTTSGTKTTYFTRTLTTSGFTTGFTTTPTGGRV